jgi:hypothetical protein
VGETGSVSDEAVPPGDAAAASDAGGRADAVDADPDSGSDRPSRRSRRALVAAAVAIVVVIAFFAVTGVTGLDAPGWMHRYPYGDLSDLATRVNAEAGDLRTPDDCWRTLPSTDDAKRDPDGPLRDIAKVDYVRSRVVVRVYANESGQIDRTTQRIVDGRLEELFADSPYSWSMVELEPSPDGWSPLVSCRLVTRGWIFGF